MISDQDIQGLEAHLDAELSSSESAALEQRLACEPELAQALRQLRAARAGRLAALESFRPSEQQIDFAIAAVHASIARRTWFRSLVRQWPRLAVAAACIAMFATGMWMRDHLAGSGQVSGLRFSQPVGLPASAHGRPVLELRVLSPNGQPLDAHAFSSIEEAEQYISRLRMQQDPSTLPR